MWSSTACVTVLAATVKFITPPNSKKENYIYIKKKTIKRCELVEEILLCKGSKIEKIVHTRGRRKTSLEGGDNEKLHTNKYQ